ncbi:unnamed protein product [Cylindrotheca closterium]|uniref:Uncharacterized protein n=1 Tax=Cylindrotheca closterium TaxID=2856 RepID=A0AAD2CJR0_9STRA|nr:unnamed protein product [Cylindrotheca closterium]
MKHGSHLFSPRHAKGCLTLGLVLLAESVAITNAVKLWANYQGGHNNRESSLFDTPFSRASRKVQECLESENESCPSIPPPSLSPVARRTLGRLTHRAVMGSKELDCCSDCSHLLTAEGQCTNIPRGGSVEQMIEVTMDGANAVMPYGIPLNGWKVIFQAFLTTLNVLCWLIPLRSKKISENKLALSLANAFSGGVFLSLAFGHLIPECVHGFEGYNEVTPYLLVLSGYLLIFFVEKVAFDTHEILHEMENADEKKVANDDANQGATSGRSAIVLLGALAVHSILEMAALGLADTFGDSAILTLSIALHQPAESIALLVAFLKSGLSKGEIIRFLSIFSAMGPIGVALGMAVNQFAAPIVDAIMVAVVAGTFVYVGATEVIPEEWEESEHKWKKFAALMGGIVSILAITQYTAKLEM